MSFPGTDPNASTGFDPSQMSMGGLLGGGQLAPIAPWQQGVGLFGSALKDAGAWLTRRPEDATAVAQYGQQMRQYQALQGRQSAVAAMTSDDPAVRQKGYTAFMMLGGDPSPFQAMQASKAMPALLSSMQPHEALADNAAVGVTPEVSATGPAADAQRAAADATNAAAATTLAPGSNLMDAMKATGSPELAMQMTPGIVENQMNVANKSLRPATIAQKRAAGYGDNDPVMSDIYGNLTSSVKPQAELDQQNFETAHEPISPYQQQDLNIKRAEAGKPVSVPMGADVYIPGKGFVSGPSPFSALPGQPGAPAGAASQNGQQASNLNGDAFLSTLSPQVRGTVKAIGDGRMSLSGFSRNPMIGMQMRNLVTQYNPDYDETDMPNRAKARAAFANGDDGKTVTAFNTFAQHLEAARPMVQALANGNVPLFNQVAQTFAKQTGSAVPTNFDMLKTILGDEQTKAIVGTRSGEGDRQQMQSAYNKAASPAQLLGAMDTASGLAAARLRAEQQKYTSQTKLRNFGDMLVPEAGSLMQRYPSAAAPASGNGGGNGASGNGNGSRPAPQQLPRTSAPTILRYDASGKRIDQ